MDRKEFITFCGSSCLGLAGLSLFLESCASIHYVQGTVRNNQLQLLRSDFVKLNDSESSYHSFVVVASKYLDYPIVVYRFSEMNYSALLLRCTHQGTELTVHGDLIMCSGHGSEFSNRGDVVQGPADQKLKSYPVTTDERNVYIQLA